MRDLETIEAAITAAETGHIVFATLHTTGAQGTVNRIIDVFPTNQQEQIRTQLSTSIIGIALAGAAAEDRRRPGGGLRDAGGHAGHRQPDPREQDLPHHLRDPDRGRSWACSCWTTTCSSSGGQGWWRRRTSCSRRTARTSWPPRSPGPSAACSRTRRRPSGRIEKSGKETDDAVSGAAAPADSTTARQLRGNAHGYSANRSDSGRPGVHHRRASWRCCWRSSSSGRGELLGQIAMSMGLITDEQLAQALAEQMGMQVVNLSDVVDPAGGAGPHHRADGPALPHHSRELRGQHADDRHVRSAEAVDHRRVAEFPGLRHPGGGGHRRRTCCRRWSGTTPAAARASRQLIADMEQRRGAGRRGDGAGEGRRRST